MGTTPRTERKMKIPVIKKKDARKRYSELLFSLIASTEQKAPAITSRKDKKTKTRGVLFLNVTSKEPNRNKIPRNIRKSPVIKTILAAYFFFSFGPLT